MFERYTERARRTIFFARYEASQYGAPYIETEHILLGLFREDKALARQFLMPDSKLEAIGHAIAQHGNKGAKFPTSVDLPLSHESKRVLAYAAEESDRVNHEHIDTPHLLVGLLREEKSFAAQLLHEQGVRLESVREQVRGSEFSPAQRASASIGRLREWLADRERRSGIWAIEKKSVGRRTTDFAIYADDPPKDDQDTASTENPGEAHPREQLNLEQPQPPLLCIEIMRDERLSELQNRCDDYIAAGVTEVWFLDLDSKRAYTVDKTQGLREFKGEVLRMAEPSLEMNLSTIFD